MTRITDGAGADRSTDRDGSRRSITLDEDVLAALTERGRSSDGDSSRIVEWFEQWAAAGGDRR